jgi:hypothetical protein
MVKEYPDGGWPPAHDFVQRRLQIGISRRGQGDTSTRATLNFPADPLFALAQRTSNILRFPDKQTLPLRKVWSTLYEF